MLYPVKLVFMLTITLLLVNIFLVTKNGKIKDITTEERQHITNWFVYNEKKYEPLLYSNNGGNYQLISRGIKVKPNGTKSVSERHHLSKYNVSIPAILLNKPIKNILKHQNLSTNISGTLMSENYRQKEMLSKPLVIGTVIGRLGNQIFQFLSSYIIARQTGHRVAIDVKSPLIHYFKNLEAVQINLKHSKYRNMQVVKEKGAGIYSADIETKVPWNKSVRLCCYFQSWKYYVNYKQQIHHKLQLHDFISQKVKLNWQIIMQRHLQQIKTNTTYQRHYNHTQVKSLYDFTYIGLHVRRQDMTAVDSIKRGYTPAPINYILNAMQFYRQRYTNVVFLVCSDDLNWCKQHIPNQYLDVIFRKQSPIYDFGTLMSCNHSIITTGTFGWWSGWLTGGTVVYYSGYPIPNTEIGNQYIAEDYYPPEWIPMK